MKTFTNQPYAPVEYTKPLTEDFDSDGPWFLELIKSEGLKEQGKPLVLDDFQEALLNHLLERLPSDDPFKRGPLRYRQVLVSMGRQNGKSTLGALLTLYGLFKHTLAPAVIGVAHTKIQADIVYQKAYDHVAVSSRLRSKIKHTKTKGLFLKDRPGTYKTYPSTSKALQGLTVTMAICDELHIMDPGVWGALAFGQTAQPKSMLIGITTAGDDNSELLKRLYQQGKDAIAEPNAHQRYGFFLWEAPEGSTLADDDALKAANPSVMCGRKSVQDARDAVLGEPVADQQRYGLNRFVEALAGWLRPETWNQLPRASEGLSGARDLVFSVDRSGNWEYASFTVSHKDDQGLVHTRLIGTMVSPRQEQIVERCLRLYRKHPGCVLVMDNHTMKPVITALHQKLGKDAVKVFYPVDLQLASSTVKSLIDKQRLAHDHCSLFRTQVPRGVTKTVGDGWAVNRTRSIGDTDALFAMLASSYYAEVKPKRVPQLF